MGVKGLTTYINQNSHRFLVPHELHDCNLVIDGNNLACQLFRWYGPHNSAYGGDYDRYSESVIHFFETLTACNVTPYVIMDGGYELRKLKTVHYRLRQKISIASKCTPAANNDVQIFPLLMKHAFKDVVRKLNIPFAQCDFEADDEIAAVARYLSCPVLSYDSDFYIYNVLYISFSTCQVGLSSRKEKDGRNVHFIKCKIYHVDSLVKHFGGLDSSLLPLMSVLLGNDYVKSSTFKNFFLHVKLPSTKTMSQQQKKIAEVIQWLKKETVESALIKILGKFKKERRSYLSKLFEQSIRSYSEEFSHTLKYLGLSNDSESNSPSISMPVIDLSDEALEQSVKMFNEEECNEESESQNESSSESEDEELKADVPLTSEQTERMLPSWLLVMFRHGLIDASVATMFYLSRWYFDPLVEDFTLPPPFELSFPIIRVTYGLIVTNDQVLKDNEMYILRCYGRNSKGKPQKIDLTPVFKTHSVDKFCNLSSLNLWPYYKRLAVLHDTMTFICKKDVKLLALFPEEWRLYAMAVVYWGRQNKEWPHVSNCHIHALVLGIIALGVVDTKIGFYRNTNAFLKNYGSRMRKAQNDEKSELVDDLCKDEAVGSVIESSLKKVSFEECLFVEEKLIEYHQGKSCPYSVTAVHSFAQFQHILHQAMILNSILGFPVPECSIAKFYSAKFITSVYADLSKRSNLEVYLDLVMSSSPTIRALHRAVVEVFFKLIPDLLVLVRKGKNKRKKKSLKKRVNVENRGDGNYESGNGNGNTSDECTHDLACLGNRFSVLSMR